MYGMEKKKKSIGITIQPVDIAEFKTSGLVGSFALIVATI